MERLPETSVEKFIDFLEGNECAMPDSLIEFLLEKSGCNCPDKRVGRMIGFATEKMLSEVIDEAIFFSESRSQKSGTPSSVLKTEDVLKGAKQLGIEISGFEYKLT